MKKDDIVFSIGKTLTTFRWYWRSFLCDFGRRGIHKPSNTYR